jgi:ABC-type sugar transport system permease subunit
MVYPFLNTIYLSLTNWNGVAPDKDFVGLANYTRMLGDEVALKAFFNNVIWVIIGTIAPVAVGLFEALWCGAGPVGPSSSGPSSSSRSSFP